ncbi:MAG: Cyclic pyranopterin monophosphate synthase accessory protein 1 [Planctomycetota bacterium]|jgi:cyclic pyranopterin monophosphate synthase
MQNVPFTHVGEGGEARMVDVAAKAETLRTAVAEGFVRLSEGVLARVLAGDLPKGAVIETARLAGIMAAKRTSDLIPMCHPLRLTEVDILAEAASGGALRLEAKVVAVDRTGVEMEAMTAVSVAALTVYDMVKAVDRSAAIDGIRLLRKTGGKSGDFSAGAGA